MTKKTFLVSFAILALVAMASTTMAQPGGGRGPGGGPGGGGPGGGGPGMMMGGGPGMMMGGGGAMGILFNEDARKELGISEDQMEKLREAGRAMMETMRPPQGGGQNGPPDFAQMREQMQKMQTESRKNLETVLSGEQVGKLDVMVFQRSGGLEGPMANVETLRALNLTDDQKKKLEEAQEKMMTAMPRPDRNIMELPEDERRAQFEKMREAGTKAREAYQAEVKATLTKEQVAKAGELMKNVPEYLQQRGGPGGPGGPGAQRRGNNLDGWIPGGGPRGENPNREQRQDRGNRSGRQFPG